MSEPVRTAREAIERAAQELNAAAEERNDSAFHDAANIVRSLPIAEGPTVEYLAMKLYAASQLETKGNESSWTAMARAVLALCGGETRERWGSWEEAAIEAAAASLPVAVDERVVEVGTLWVNVARAVLAKAPPREP